MQGPISGQHSLITSGLMASGPAALPGVIRARALWILSGVRIDDGSRVMPWIFSMRGGGAPGKSVEARVFRDSSGVFVVVPSGRVRVPRRAEDLSAKVLRSLEATGVDFMPVQ